MSDLYDRIEGLCRSNGINVTRMCRECGISRASMTELKMGRNKTLSAETLALIGKYFGISIETLLGQDTDETPVVSMLQTLRDEDRALLDVAKGMTPEQVKLMTQFAKSLKGEDN